LYAPAQALLYGLNFQQTIAWIITGLPWDCIHAIGNLASGILILPLVQVLRRLEQTVPR
jgi:energy-coupling factor transport system substrate-specific component